MCATSLAACRKKNAFNYKVKKKYWNKHIESSYVCEKESKLNVSRET